MKTIIGVILFCVVIITTVVVFDRKRTRLAEEAAAAAAKPKYITLEDDLYYIHDNIKIVERTRNPLDFQTGEYYIIIHYKDGSKRTIYFRDRDYRNIYYKRIVGALQ